MLIFGIDALPCSQFVYCATVEEIASTTPKVVILTDSVEVARHCFEHQLEYAFEAKSIKCLLIAYNLGAGYVLCSSFELSCELQEIATTYLMQTKVVWKIDDESSIEKGAKAGIDGVVFASALRHPLK